MSKIEWADRTSYVRKRLVISERDSLPKDVARFVLCIHEKNLFCPTSINETKLLEFGEKFWAFSIKPYGPGGTIRQCDLTRSYI
jgi:hypothetical protein